MTEQATDRIIQARAIIQAAQLLAMPDELGGEVKSDLLHDLLAGAVTLLDGLGE